MTEASPSSPRPSSKPPHAPWRRWVRRGVWGVFGLVAVVLLLVAGVLVYATSSTGEGWLLQKGLSLANGQLAGKVEAGSVDLSLNGATLRDVKLYTPEGELVAEAALVDARLALLPLVGQHVVLRSALLEKPRLYLVQDERGLNLMRAVAPREPKPEEPDTGRGSLRLSVKDFKLEDGYVDFQAESEESPRHVRLEDFDVSGAASYAAATVAFDARLEATGGLTLPVSGPVKLSLRGQGEEENLSADVSLTVAGLEAVARGGMRGMSEVWAEIQRLSLTPDTARAVVPTWPLLVPVSLEGNGQKQGDVARTSLDVRAGTAKVDLDGSFNLVTMRTDGVSLKAQDINLQELVENGPPTSIVANLSARGGGTSLETLDGDVELTVSPSKFREQPLGPVDLRASAKDGHYTLSRLRVLVPGASLDARGQGTAENIQLKGSLSASDLAVLGQTVGKLGPGPALPLAGSGVLDFQVKGPLRTPGVSASGTFSSLAYADTVLKDLNLKASLPDATKPLSVDASVVVGEMSAGGRTFQNLAATVVTQDRALQANVSTQGQVELSLTLTGTVDENQEGLAVSAMTLAYPEATWRLQRPTHVGFGGGRIEVKPTLTLAAENQRLAVQLVKVGERVDAQVDVGELDLSKLPKAFVPESLGLGGMLSAQVSAKGALSRPDATFSLSLADGRFQQYTGLGLELKGTYVKDTAQGTLSAQVPAAQLSANFKVPVQAVLKRRKDELNLRVELSRLDVAEVMKLLNRPEPLKGQLSGLLEVTGPARDPRLAFTLRGQGLEANEMLPGRRPLDPLGFELRASSDASDGTLDVRLDMSGLGKEAYVTLATPFTLGQLIAKPPTADEVMRTVVGLEAQLNEVPVRLLARVAGFRGRGTDGTLSLKLALNGSVLVPQGKLELITQGATFSGIPPLDAHLTVLGEGKDTRLELTAKQLQGSELRPLMDLSAIVSAPLGALQDPDVIGWVPFQLKGRVHPTPLSHLPGLAKADSSQKNADGTPKEESYEGLQGILSLELNAAGTPAAPKLDLTVGLQELGVNKPGVNKPDEKKLPLGQARFHYAYANARSQVDALITAPAGGTLLVEANVPLDLSLNAMKQTLDVSTVPLDVTLRARGFDLAFLSGAHDMIRTLGGVLEADASIAGKVGAPTLKGNVNWKNGQLGLAGFGSYRDIEVALEVSEEQLQLKELFARAGSGELKLTADAKATRGVFELTGKARLKDFPIVSDDQLLAIVTLDSTLAGRLSAQSVNIQNLSITKADIELPEIKRKDLQPLEKPGDIVLVRNGLLVNKRRKPAAASTPPGTGGTGNAGTEQENVPEEEEPTVQRIYEVHVRAPNNNLRVHGTDLNVTVGLPLNDFYVSYRNKAEIFGTVRVREGSVAALGRALEIQKNSEVRFGGPPLAPYLNITAEHNNERENVKVFIHVRGQGKDFTIEPTSEPPMSETEIYTLLATGRSTLERNSGASMSAGAQAASVVGSLVASQAKKALSAELPLDVFSVEAGDSGGLQGTRLEVGKYISDKIYVGYTGRVGEVANERENSNAVRFEYQFNPSWSLEANYGDARSGGLDLIWSKDY
ncbi:translocation/assembly module TamB domain-containing protein [Stigmatella sp. ncwal1]|uniref:Translocation/assembly module TamB domain-containing protein n=1 Tax=Stigmatella ashevillensis TaxID=2995309 RepID=A0ABT5DCV2_9BACT|nr:translocation/assembly module TamB domain-containing protein [Stigmatella ashevillena]MDC0710598.1 translocation/assembly module TamB domain-containing protein [Stigmatella ashevillena]